MGAYVSVGSGTLSAAHNSQEELRKQWEIDYVDGAFRGFMGESFVPYIETISEIFTPPRSTGWASTCRAGSGGSPRATRWP